MKYYSEILPNMLLFHVTLYFILMNTIEKCQHRPSIHNGNIWSCTKWKTKKVKWGFLFIKHSKFWYGSLEHFIECKPFIHEEWVYIGSLAVSPSFFVSKREKDVCIYCTCVHTQGICYKNVIYVLLPTR